MIKCLLTVSISDLDNVAEKIFYYSNFSIINTEKILSRLVNAFVKVNEQIMVYVRLF